MASASTPTPAIPSASVAPKRHVILNDLLAGSSGNGSHRTFHLFSKLPPEIGLKIWTYGLERYRILTVAVSDLGGPKTSPPTPHYCSANQLGRIVSGRKYFLRDIAGYKLSKLLRVCRSSRDAALAFYRVHIPAEHIAFRPVPPLCFNPEYDILRIETFGDEPTETFVDMLHDARANDPAGKGVLNLAAQSWEIGRLLNFGTIPYPYICLVLDSDIV